MRARPPSREKLVYASDYGRVINDALTNKVQLLLFEVVYFEIE